MKKTKRGYKKWRVIDTRHCLTSKNQYQNMTGEKKQKIKKYGKNIDKIGLKKANKKTNNTWKNPKNYANNLLKNKRKQYAKNVLM